MNELMHDSDTQKIQFQHVLEALLDDDKPFDPRYLYRLSDLEPQELIEFEKNWPQVPDRRRLALLQDIEIIGETNYLVSFEAVCRCALKDIDPRVRTIAVRSLWEYENTSLVPTLLQLLEVDTDPDVRAALATALGKYVYLGEIEELPQHMLDTIVDRLLAIVNGSDATLVRRRALEALGFSSREEIPALIEKAYYSGNDDWLMSAVFAMGRSANQGWSRHVIDQLAHDSPEVRREAARAVGELEAGEATEMLVEFLDDEDDEVRMAAVWSLSQLGGEGVADILEELLDFAEDEEEADFIEQALDNLAFTEDMQRFSLFEFTEDELEGGDDEDVSFPDDNEDGDA